MACLCQARSPWCWWLARRSFTLIRARGGGHRRPCIQMRGHCPEPCVIGNATDVEFGDMRFDVVHNISNLEHFGSGEYGVPYRGGDLDLAAVRNLNRFVAPGGVHLVSVPFGKHTPAKPWRMYDAARIGQLREAMLPLVPFEERYMCSPGGRTWQDTTPEYLADKPYRYDRAPGGFGVYLGAFTLTRGEEA